MAIVDISNLVNVSWIWNILWTHEGDRSKEHARTLWDKDLYSDTSSSMSTLCRHPQNVKDDHLEAVKFQNFPLWYVPNQITTLRPHEHPAVCPQVSSWCTSFLLRLTVYIAGLEFAGNICYRVLLLFIFRGTKIRWECKNENVRMRM